MQLGYKGPKMSPVGKFLALARPVVKDSFLVTNIPFLDRKIPDTYSSLYKEDFRPFHTKRAEPFKLTPAQRDHKNLRHFKEYLTEVKASYHPHPLQQMTRTPRWIMLNTNFRLQTDRSEVTFLSTHSEKYRPWPLQPRPTPFRPIEAIKKTQHAEKTPVSTSRASFIPHHHCPVVKNTSKNLEGFPTIKEDGRRHSSVSQNDSFQGIWGRAAKPVEKPSSVAFGDPVKIVEKDSTCPTSWPPVCRPAVVKERLKLNLGDFSQDLKSSTTTEAACHNLADPVDVKRRNQKSIPLPEGDTETRRSKKRMLATTYRSSFSNLNHTLRPVQLPDPGLRTKSHVEFGPFGLCYTTTNKECYSKQQSKRATPVDQLLSNILSGQGHKWKPSMTKIDFLPLKPTTCPPKSNFRFPQTHVASALATGKNDSTNAQRPGENQLSSPVAMQ